MKKQCSVCEQKKEVSEFQTRIASRDGLTAACTECLKIRDAERYEKEKPRRLAAQKIYFNTPGGKDAKKRAVANWLAKNRVKRAAHQILNNALRDGKIVKGRCEVCGSRDVHGHHDDYTKPLKVRWLCPKHHSQHHKET